MFRLTTITGYSLDVSDEEAAAIGKAINEDSKTIVVQGNIITTSNITGLWKDSVVNQDELEKRTKMTEGYLHDGSRAVRQFGVWVNPDGPTDERGRFEQRYDPSYYPEVAADCLATVGEWEEMRTLPVEVRKEKMLGKVGRPRMIEEKKNESFEKLEYGN